MIQKHSPTREQAINLIDDGSKHEKPIICSEACCVTCSRPDCNRHPRMQRRAASRCHYKCWAYHWLNAVIEMWHTILASWYSGSSIICDRKRYVLPPVPRRVVRVVRTTGCRNEERKDIVAFLEMYLSINKFPIEQEKRALKYFINNWYFVLTFNSYFINDISTLYLQRLPRICRESRLLNASFRQRNLLDNDHLDCESEYALSIAKILNNYAWFLRPTVVWWWSRSACWSWAPFSKIAFLNSINLRSSRKSHVFFPTVPTLLPIVCRRRFYSQEVEIHI